jgi:chitin disaccharide deacetylase
MSELKRLLIVNADDFGRSHGVNRGVEVAHEKGIVTSASLMVRRSAAQEAATYAKQHPELSVGLHVDLGEWIYREGEWRVVDAVIGPLHEEIRSQVAAFVSLVGQQPTHLDSHQHVHRQGEVAARMAELARELRVPLRASEPRIHFCGDFYGQTGKGETFHRAITVEGLLALLVDLPDGVTELGCHPGIGTEDDFPYGAERVLEVRTLCDLRVRAALSAYGIELRPFGNFTSPPATFNNA